MRYSIGWRESALDDLTAAWLEADAVQRDRITKAAYSIEQELRFRAIEDRNGILAVGPMPDAPGCHCMLRTVFWI